jgi:hypothetical protein
MRATNAIDFWRGLALVMIFIDHVPGNYYSNWTMQNFAISDAAELFVFLAGCSLSVATGGPHRPEPWLHTLLRLVSRAVQIYRAQIVVTVIALALLAAAAILRENPLYIEWNNAGAAFYDPLRTTVGTVLLSYQLHFVDILPMYVVLMLLAPLLIGGARRWPKGTIALSFTIYATALIIPLNLPTWPVTGGWFFNPLSWQFLLLVGFLSSELYQSSQGFHVWLRRLFWPALVIVGAGLILKLNHYAPDPYAVPWPRYLFLFDKTYLSPVRLLSVLSIALVFFGVFATLDERLDRTVRFLCGLGRNSLAVFCIGSLLSVAGQIVHFIVGGGLTIDTIIAIIGITLMGWTAWFVEWRARSQVSARSR